MGQGWIANRPQETELVECIVLHQFGMTAKDHTGGLQVHCKLVDLTVATAVRASAWPGYNARVARKAASSSLSPVNAPMT